VRFTLIEQTSQPDFRPSRLLEESIIRESKAMQEIISGKRESRKPVMAQFGGF
jgi:hypothetical protein